MWSKRKGTTIFSQFLYVKLTKVKRKRTKREKATEDRNEEEIIDRIGRRPRRSGEKETEEKPANRLSSFDGQLIRKIIDLKVILHVTHKDTNIHKIQTHTYQHTLVYEMMLVIAVPGFPCGNVSGRRREGSILESSWGSSAVASSS